MAASPNTNTLINVGQKKEGGQGGREVSRYLFVRPVRFLINTRFSLKKLYSEARDEIELVLVATGLSSVCCFFNHKKNISFPSIPCFTPPKINKQTNQNPKKPYHKQKTTTK